MAPQDGAQGAAGVVARLKLKHGTILQEFGFDADVDSEFREAVVDAIGSDLVDEDYGEVTDGVVLWFRDGDDDLTDFLVDVQTLLGDGCPTLLLTPKNGRDGYVQRHDVEEASSLAGLHATSTYVVGDWTLTQLVDKGRSK